MADASVHGAPDAMACGALTVREVLGFESLRVGSPEVVAGSSHLDAPIRWAHAGEVRSLPSLLRGGELLLTTGLALRDDPKAMRRFAAELAERGVAALVLELGSTFTTTPRALVESAEAHALPLVALHREVAFVEVTEAVNHALASRQLLHNDRLESLEQALTALVVDGAGIPEVLARLADELGNPVVLQRSDGELLFHAVHRADSGEVLRGWDAFRRQLPDAPDAVTADLPTGREVGGGALVALAVDQPLGDLVRPALDRTARLVAILSRQLREEEILAARARGDMLAELMETELTETELAHRVTSMGFPRRVPYLLPCVLTGPVGTRTGSRAAVWTMVWREIRQDLEANVIPVLGGLMPGEGRVAFVVGLPTAGHREARAEALAQVSARALEGQFGEGGQGLLYVGGACRSWTRAISGLKDVEQASASPRPDVKGWYDATLPDLQRLLWSLGSSADVRTFVERRLGPIIEHDGARRSELVRTLEVYLECGGRKTETARALHLERQSLYHRLTRIESLLGASLDDADTRLGAHLALRVRRLVSREDDDHDRPAQG
jgi:purine catabolism regulator